MVCFYLVIIGLFIAIKALFLIGLCVGFGNIIGVIFVVAMVFMYGFVFQVPAIAIYKLIKERLVPSIVTTTPKIRQGIISFFYDDESL